MSKARRIWQAIQRDRREVEQAHAAYQRMRQRLTEAGVTLPDETGDLEKDLRYLAATIGNCPELKLAPEPNGAPRLYGLMVDEIEARVIEFLASQTPEATPAATGKRKRKSKPALERNLAWLEEYERDYPKASIKWFAKHKGENYDLMRQAFKEARDHLDKEREKRRPK